MIAPRKHEQTPGEVIAPMFDRSGLPDVVQILEDRPAQGLRSGDLLTWSDEVRAYMDSGGRWCVRADYVRRFFFDKFNHPAPPRPRQRELF